MKTARLSSIEVFTGAGGLALGLTEAGFHHSALVELDAHSCRTLNANRELFGLPSSEEVTPTDVNAFDWRAYEGRIDLLAGGVPCQPFSLGGKHLGHRDNRNLFPAMIGAVRDVRPSAIVVENVKGLLRPGFRPYFDYILRQLEMPELRRRDGESWLEHDGRLTSSRSSYVRSGHLHYEVRSQLLQCADYGAPQSRERVLIVAFRDDLGEKWRPSPATHSLHRLLYEQWVTGRYWEEHDIQRPRVPDALKMLVESLQSVLIPPQEKRWRTVRDAISDLPLPHRRRVEGNNDHFANPGARAYPGHVGSSLDWPAKTLKAGVHGVPGGENMLRYPNGRVRYFTVREAARLQTFPDQYHFPGTWGECFRQLGNAVPVIVGKTIGDQVASRLRDAGEAGTMSLALATG